MTRRLAAGAIAVIVIAAVWSFTHRNPATNPTTPPTPTPSSPAGPAAPKSTTTSTTLGSETDGHDADESGEPGSEQVVLEVAAQFLAGWTQPEMGERITQLTPVTTPRLLELLKKVPAQRTEQLGDPGAPRIVTLNATTAVAAADLSSGTRVAVFLIATPGSRHGWLVDSVDQCGTNCEP